MKYKPHDYQAYATRYILEHPISAIFLDMGLGKSIITLSAIFDLCLRQVSDQESSGHSATSGGKRHVAGRD